MEVLATHRATLEGSVLWALWLHTILFFKKGDGRLVTFKSGNTRTQIDFFFMRVSSRKMNKYCKVIPSECSVTQHKLLVMDVEIRGYKEKEEKCWGQ